MGLYSDQSPLLTTEEAVQYLKTSRSSFYRLRDLGLAKAIFIGTKKPYFRKTDLDDLISSCS